MKSVILSEDVRQEEPVGFMVFPYKDIDFDYFTFDTEVEARNFAMEQEEKAGAPEDSWPIYALWASDWKKK